ncbi:LNS2-domain-containing protein, partial [Rozella allomycis CSF55]
FKLVYHSKTGNSLGNLVEPNSKLPCTTLCFRPQVANQQRTKNVLLAGYTDGHIRHWHSTSGRKLSEISEGDNQIFTVDFFNDGSQFVSAGSDYTLRVYDENTQSLIVSMYAGRGEVTAGHSNRIFCAKFHPKDPNILVSGGWDNTIQVWDIRAQCSIRSIYGPHICGEGVDFTDNGEKIITGSYLKDQPLQIWNFQTGNLIENVQWTISDDKKPCMLYCAQYSHGASSNKFIVAGGGGGLNEAKIFNTSYKKNQCFGTIQNVSNAIYTVALSKSETQLAVGGGGKTLYMYDVEHLPPSQDYCFPSAIKSPNFENLGFEMQFVGRVISTVSEFYKDINPSTLSGAIDIIVVEDELGEYHCSPFHVRFGKLQLLRAQDKIVEVCVNGKKAGINMKLGDAGEAFFVIETANPPPENYATSPLLTPKGDLTESLASLDLQTEQSNIARVEEMIRNKEEMFKQKSSSEPRDIGMMQQSHEDLIIQQRHEHEQIMDIYGVSPPKNPSWSWNWGEIPQRASEEEILREKEDIKKRYQERIEDITKATSDTEMTHDLLFEDNEVSEIKPNENSKEDLEINEEEISKTFISFILTASYLEELKEINFDKENDLQLSLCGNIIVSAPQDLEIVFNNHLVTFSIYQQNCSIFENENAIFRIEDKFLTWQLIAPQITSLSLYGKSISKESWTLFLDAKIEPLKKIQQGSTTLGSLRRWWRGRNRSTVNAKNININKTKKAEVTRARSLSPTMPKESSSKEKKNYAKSLRLTSEQIKSLPLNVGMNEISFSVASSKATCKARLFKWRKDTKVIISDIDGTITKYKLLFNINRSDVMGHLLTMVGRDWTQPGVAKLYSAIKKNGYEFLYLTSRAIGQVTNNSFFKKADYTREYLKSVEQESFQLPEGPVIMSPDRLIAAFHREVIMRRPEEFKIACLKDIKSLFIGENPFCAGFGNRITDVLSYRSVEVPCSKVFTVNSQGEIKLELFSDFRSTYTKLTELADQLFPPLNTKEIIDNNFNDAVFWRNPLPLLIETTEANSPTENDITNVEDSEDNESSYSYL